MGKKAAKPPVDDRYDDLEGMNDRASVASIKLGFRNHLYEK